MPVRLAEIFVDELVVKHEIDHSSALIEKWVIAELAENY